MSATKPKPAPARDWQTPARRLTLACRGAFIRVIKAAIHDKDRPSRFGDDSAATEIFERALKAGEIKEQGLAGIGGVVMVYSLN